MGTLSDDIEAHIKRMLLQTVDGMISLRRSDLAARFECVPSQINYVLTTRFTPERGFVVESRRGGGGYIRIVRLRWKTPEDFRKSLFDRMGDEVSELSAEHLLSSLVEAGMIGKRARSLVRATLQRECERMPQLVRGRVRASLLRAMLGLLLDTDGRKPL